MFMINRIDNRPFILTCSLMVLLIGLAAELANAQTTANKPIKVFILAGDENVLEEGVIEGRTDGKHDDFFPNAKPTQGEKRKHVHAEVYAGAYSPDTDYDKSKPIATAEVEIGYQRTQRAPRGQRGRVPVEMSPFPAEAYKAGHTTVLRGYISVKYAGRYEFHPGEGDSAFSVTTVEGKEVYRRDAGQTKATITPIELEPNKRYSFKTVFFAKPGHAFSVPLVNKPGTLTTVVADNPKYAFLQDKEGQWVTRDDVVLYDAHPVHNNTRAPARPLRVGVPGRGGPEATPAMGVDLMLGHVLANAFDEPVMIVRFARKHPIWFRRGSLDLSHAFRPPSSGGGADHDGSWDVIHFNHGIHDTAYRNPEKYTHNDETKFPIGIPLDRYESNLRKIVAKLKKTGATLIWARITPVRDDTKGWKSADIDRYNAVADKVMKENGVIINDLYAESIRQGYPKRPDVHSVGSLAPKVTEVIEKALAERKNKTKPLPRVLMWGDSITGSYWEQVKKNLDGKAYVCKNPTNAGHSDFGLESADDWINIKRYLLNGQSYLELVEGVRHALDQPDKVFPGYEGQSIELAGLIWFQGIADGVSPSKSEAYEDHLANLIRACAKT